MLKAIERLSELLAGLPGIGVRSSTRLAVYLLELPRERLQSLLETIRDVREQTVRCERCGCLAVKTPCASCLAPFSDEGILCVVETPLDAFSLENSVPPGSKFHVLGGKLAPLRGIGPEDLNVPHLINRLDEPGIKEVLLALPADVEGEATASFLAGELGKKESIRVSRLAFGVSVGSTLSSSDPRSIQKSISARIFY